MTSHVMKKLLLCCRSLLVGSGLDKAAGYSEDTSDDVCTQYSKRKCDIY